MSASAPSTLQVGEESIAIRSATLRLAGSDWFLSLEPEEGGMRFDDIDALFLGGFRLSPSSLAELATCRIELLEGDGSYVTRGNARPFLTVADVTTSSFEPVSESSVRVRLAAGGELDGVAVPVVVDVVAVVERDEG